MARPPRSALKAPIRAKWISASWVEEQLHGVPFESLYDPFAGSCALGRYFKRRGKRVVVSDLLESHHCFGRALIESEQPYSLAEPLSRWLGLIKDPAVFKRFAPWANVHFTTEETIWLGIWHKHLQADDLEPGLRALGAIAVYHTMHYWLSFNRQAQQHKPLAPTAAFQHYLQTLNTWVCNNGRRNQALWGDASQLASKVEADVLYAYPPTPQGYLDYSEPLHLFEAWVKGDSQWVLPGLAVAPSGEPSLGQVIPEPSDYGLALQRFLSQVEHIPVWALAFHDRYPLSETDIRALVSGFRPILRLIELSIHTGEALKPPGERLLIARAK